jgi:hypothetical protein
MWLKQNFFDVLSGVRGSTLVRVTDYLDEGFS